MSSGNGVYIFKVSLYEEYLGISYTGNTLLNRHAT